MNTHAVCSGSQSASGPPAPTQCWCTYRSKRYSSVFLQCNQSCEDGNAADVVASMIKRIDNPTTTTRARHPRCSGLFADYIIVRSGSTQQSHQRVLDLNIDS